MSVTPQSLAAPFMAAAEAARRAEDDYRRDYARRVAELERARTFAFRRRHLVEAVAGAVIACETVEGRAEAARAWLVREYDLDPASAGHAAVLDQFAPVAAAVVAAIFPPEDNTAPADLGTTLARFESWYETTTGQPFFARDDRPQPDRPLVDF